MGHASRGLANVAGVCYEKGMASSKKKAKADAPPKVGDWLRITCSHSDAFYSRVKEVRKAPSGAHHVYATDRCSMTMRFLWRAGRGLHHKFGCNNHYAHRVSKKEGLLYEARAKFWRAAHQKSERLGTLLEDTSVREDDKDLFPARGGDGVLRPRAPGAGAPAEDCRERTEVVIHTASMNETELRQLQLRGKVISFYVQNKNRLADDVVRLRGFHSERMIEVVALIARPALGATMDVRGETVTVVKVHPLGTADVRRPNGEHLRVTGLGWA